MFIVRLKESNELVGLFAAPTLRDLWWAIDECTDPSDCEYRRLTHGGIYWHAAGTPVLSAANEEEFTDDLSGIEFSERLFLATLSCRTNTEQPQREWRSFPDNFDHLGPLTKAE